MKRLSFMFLISLILLQEYVKLKTVSEFYINEYECIDKVLFDPYLYRELEKMPEEICEMGVSFNLEKLFRLAELNKTEELGFEEILNLLQGNFNLSHDHSSLSSESDILKESMIKSNFQRMSVDYLKSNPKILSQSLGVNISIDDQNSLNYENGLSYLEKIKNNSLKYSDSNLFIKKNTLDIDNKDFKSSIPEVAGSGYGESQSSYDHIQGIDIIH